MTPEERAELDRLLDLRDREALLTAAPPEPPTVERAEVAEMIEALERQHADVRARRAELAPDSEWLED